MTPNECRKFDREIREQVYALWKASLDSRDEKSRKSGYAVFYGPLSFKPKLMLIGLNPGGGEDACFDEESELKPRPPSQKMEYVEIEETKDDYKLAIETRGLFKRIGFSEWLANSVKLNLHFFRSKKWTHLPKKERPLCLNIVKNIIEKLKPQILICEGMTTYDMVKNHKLAGKLCQDHSDFYGVKGKNRLYVSAHTEGVTAPNRVIGIVHLSSGWGVGKSEVTTLGGSLSRDFRG